MRILLGLMLWLAVLPAGAQTLIYERSFSMVRDTDNRLVITLTEPDRVEVYRPVFMTRSGHYQFRVLPEVIEFLLGAYEDVVIQARDLDARVQARTGAGPLVITDPELTRFQRQDPSAEIAVWGVKPYAAVFVDEPGLAELAELEAAFWALMDDLLEASVP